jgi:hypothetical protein
MPSYGKTTLFIRSWLPDQILALILIHAISIKEAVGTSKLRP